MSRILIIENSATLRLVLVRLFRARGYEVDQAANAQIAFDRIRGESDKRRLHDAIIYGWPKYATAADGRLLVELARSIYTPQPILVFSDTADPLIEAWFSKRRLIALLFWNDYADALGMLDKILPSGPVVGPQSNRVASIDGIRILFVDDSRIVRTYYNRLLTRNSYQVDLSSNIDEAFEMALSGTYDIAIIDYFMPGGNGDELCRRLRDDIRTAQITSAILTGTYKDNIIKEVLDAGASECMFKNEVDELFLARISAMSRLISVRKSVDSERKRLESILSSVGEGVYGVNNEGMISFFNPAAKQILGYSHHNQLIGKSPHQMFHYAHEDGDKIDVSKCLLLKAYAAGQELRSWETVFWHHNGRPIPVECTVYPLKIEDEVRGSVVAFRDISQRKGLENELRWQATHDELTALFNRRYLEEQLSIEVTRVMRSDEVAALLFIDLDRFKYVNDTAGHAAGDKLLVEVSHQLKSRLRESDILARLGGDEFAVILRNINQASVIETAESFRDLMAHCHFSYKGKNYKINASIGVAMITKDTTDHEEVLSNADVACHVAKSKGRNQTHIYNRSNDEKVALDLELGWSARLREALQSNLFVLNYQPILSMAHLDMDNLPENPGELWNQLTEQQISNHFEVLVRLPGADGELISPHAFIPTAERFNLMQDIDLWVLENALEKLAQLDDNQVTFSINLSGLSMGSSELADKVLKLLTRYQLQASSIIFEITETSAIENLDMAQDIIKQLKAVGCRFALDDFGTGFSSFSQLKHLPVDFIKIDGSFVQGMSDDKTDQAMVFSINDIAHSLGRKTIAEYVESADILRLLKQCGVDYVQGYYISRPLSEDKVLARLPSSKPTISVAG